MEDTIRKTVRKENIVSHPFFDTYVCLDIETTSRPMNRIIEIGAVLVVKGRKERVYTRLVNPGIRIPREIVQLTGISDKMVSGRRSIWQVLPELKQFVGERIIVGHDLINNDMKNLLQVGQAMGISFDNQVFDTLHFARRFMPGTCGLSHLTEILQIPWEGRHRAANDAQANMEVFEKLKILYYLMDREGIRLNEKEIAKVAHNTEAYLGVQDKFRFSY
ncbi:3'-5' exonuclease [Proteiniclasticum sp. QWL-01]|uniref:3'-5' exonuclease n=1 Tax=Proteiniclasticum sp. QWL-01 TaxID=3036945 RepID=UPI0024101765|nr:3'-5' exonuclease [Proteiniclasticum sp. QWL-01]WFF73032.1 3'-5' exonuclease [Proteiniclasticum sp. QWL-01]